MKVLEMCLNLILKNSKNCAAVPTIIFYRSWWSARRFNSQVRITPACCWCARSTSVRSFFL